MDQRPPTQEVIRDLKTKSAKIRALALAGYDRVEIGELLRIRYQHVRKVLLDSGLGVGLRRQVEAEREPIEADILRKPREATSWKVLANAGFQLLGEWTQNPESA